MQHTPEEEKHDNKNYNPDGSPKARTIFAVFGKVAAIVLLIASPVLYYNRRNGKTGKSKGHGGD